MANGMHEARSFLKDVQLHGSGVVDKRKLLWMVGWGQDRPGAWADILSIWSDLGGTKNALTGVEAGTNIIFFTRQPSAAARVMDWAKA
jgi:hypothetical protein